MAKAGKKIKEGAIWLADKLIPKSTKETVKDAAMNAAGADDASIDSSNLTQEEKDALKKARDEAMGMSAKDISEMLTEAQKLAGSNLTNKQNEEARNARVAAAAGEDVSRKAAYQAARNTGANRAASSAIGSSVDTRGLQSNAASALRSAATSTQADYLNKMGYVQGLESNLENTKAGSFLNTLSGVGQGAMTGAGTGASIGGFIPL